MSTQPLVTPTPLRTPLIDLKTGLVTREWAPFFQSVINVGGAVVNITNQTIDIGSSLMFDDLNPVDYSEAFQAAAQQGDAGNQRDWAAEIQAAALLEQDPPNVAWGQAISDLQVQQAFSAQTVQQSPVQPAPPATSTAYGEPGMLAYDAGFIYVCTAPNTWVRAALSTF